MSHKLKIVKKRAMPKNAKTQGGKDARKCPYAKLFIATSRLGDLVLISSSFAAAKTPQNECATMSIFPVL